VEKKSRGKDGKKTSNLYRLAWLKKQRQKESYQHAEKPEKLTAKKTASNQAVFTPKTIKKPETSDMQYLQGGVLQYLQINIPQLTCPTIRNNHKPLFFV
jgi:hypothetical protein